MEWQEKFYRVNGVRLHVVEAGPPEGPVLIFLHGFPEFWYGWRKQIGFFAEQGYRVVAPDQRGYNRSSKPPKVSDFALQHLTADVAALIKSLTNEKVCLVGHDWGGAVAWAVAMHHPHLLQKLIVLNLPHPRVMHWHLRRNPRQLLRSWYVGFFQLPLLPEFFCRAFGYRALTRSLVRTAHPGTFPPAVLDCYKQAWLQPGALKAMIGWYRGYRHNCLPPKTVHTPTLLIWGTKDAFLGEEMARPSLDHCTNARLELLENATHWLHLEQPEQVNSLILDFIGQE